MANQTITGMTVPGLPQPQGTPYINTQHVYNNSHINNGPQAANKIAQGNHSQMTSTEIENSTHIGINAATEDDLDETVNGAETVPAQAPNSSRKTDEVDSVPAQAPNSSRKTDEVDSGCAGYESGNSITPNDQQQHSVVNSKDSKGIDPHACSIRQLRYHIDMGLEGAENRIIGEVKRMLEKNGPPSPSRTVQPSARSRKRSGKTLVTSFDAPSTSKQRKVQFPQHGSTAGAVPGTTNHPLVHSLNVTQNALQENDHQFVGLDIGALGISDQNVDTDTYRQRRTENYVANLTSPDKMEQGTCELSPNTNSQISGRAASSDDIMELHNALNKHTEFLDSMDLSFEMCRLSSFIQWPHRHNKNLAVALSRSGFYYLGALDLTRCILCGCILGNWHSDDNVEERHRASFPNCPMARAKELDDDPSYQPHTKPGMDEDNWDERIASFSKQWPVKLRSIVGAIVDTGFSYSGYDDRVVCKFCGGVADRWKEDDDPWDRHAKLYPNCQFLLKSKGPDYVKSCNPSWIPNDVILPQPAPQAINGHALPRFQPSHSNVEPPKEKEQCKKQTKEDLIHHFMKKNCDFVGNVKKMQFPDILVRAAFDRKLSAYNFKPGDVLYRSVGQLVDDIIQMQNDWQNSRN